MIFSTEGGNGEQKFKEQTMLASIKDVYMMLFLKLVKLLKTTKQPKDKTTTKSTVYLRLKIL